MVTMQGIVDHFLGAMRGLRVAGTENWKVKVSENYADFGGAVVRHYNGVYQVGGVRIDKNGKRRIRYGKSMNNPKFIGVLLTSCFMSGTLLKPRM